MCEDRALGMYSVAEAVQLVKRNCLRVISKLKTMAISTPHQWRLRTTGHLNGHVSPLQNLFSKAELKLEAQILGGWHGVPFPFTHLAVTDYFFHEHHVST